MDFLKLSKHISGSYFNTETNLQKIVSHRFPHFPQLGAQPSYPTWYGERTPSYKQTSLDPRIFAYRLYATYVVLVERRHLDSKNLNERVKLGPEGIIDQWVMLVH